MMFINGWKNGLEKSGDLSKTELLILLSRSRQNEENSLFIAIFRMILCTGHIIVVPASIRNFMPLICSLIFCREENLHDCIMSWSKTKNYFLTSALTQLLTLIKDC